MQRIWLVQCHSHDLGLKIINGKYTISGKVQMDKDLDYRSQQRQI